MHKSRGYAASAGNGRLAPFNFDLRHLRENDVLIDILYCGICHSDIHTVRNEWDGTVYRNGTIYPCIPGHEIVGRVRAVGNAVTKFKTGDLAAAGTMVDSCAARANWVSSSTVVMAPLGPTTRRTESRERTPTADSLTRLSCARTSFYAYGTQRKISRL